MRRLRMAMTLRNNKVDSCCRLQAKFADHSLVIEEIR